MTMNTGPSSRPIADVPLPGHYDVLSVQINVTMYPRSGRCKYVVTLRDPAPMRQVELSRFAAECSWVEIRDRLDRQLTEVCNTMTYLAGLSCER
jgi:hypothetical protein